MPSHSIFGSQKWHKYLRPFSSYCFIVEQNDGVHSFPDPLVGEIKFRYQLLGAFDFENWQKIARSYYVILPSLLTHHPVTEELMPSCRFNSNTKYLYRL